MFVKNVSQTKNFKLIIGLAVMVIIIGYTPPAKANVLHEIWNLVKTTVNNLKDGVHLEDFDLLISQLLDRINSGSFTSLPQPNGGVMDKIIFQKPDVIVDIELGKESVQNTALSKDALEKMQTQSKKVGENIEQSLKLSEEAKSFKISQKILQHSVAQDALIAERQGIMVELLQQAQIDRAVSIEISSSILDELLSANTSEVRGQTATALSPTDSSVLLNLPAFHDPRSNSTSVLTTNSPIIEDLLEQFGRQ